MLTRMWKGNARMAGIRSFGSTGSERMGYDRSRRNASLRIPCSRRRS